MWKGRGPLLQIQWTRLPFRARNRDEFQRGLTDWLGQVFYERLPALGYEIREEQIYTTFRIARALACGQTLFAEAGTGTGKSFAYLLPLVCWARFQGRPAIIASATGVLQAQLASPEGDIQTLSRLLDLGVDARLAADPGEYLCPLKAETAIPARRTKGWTALKRWTAKTKTGARSEVPSTPDELWSLIAWEESLPCDTCKRRATCHLMMARRHYRSAGDLIVTDHARLAQDLLTRAERQEAGQLPLLPTCSAIVVDEGHHLPEVWQRAQGFALSSGSLRQTLDRITTGFTNKYGERSDLDTARRKSRLHLERLLLTAREASQSFLHAVLAAAEPGEGKRHVERGGTALAASEELVDAISALQDELVTEEAMQQGTDAEMALRAYQSRLDGVLEALDLFQSADSIAWVEGEDLWLVPRETLPLHGPDRLPKGTPLLFSSATLEPAYAAQILHLERHDRARVGVPFNLAAQVLVYRPARADHEVAAVEQVIRAMQGRSLLLLPSLAEVERYRRALSLPWRMLCEGDADRGFMLDAFRQDRFSVLVGSTFWEGVDVPGEALSCVIIPRLPFPAHDPLIRDRREKALARGEDPFMAVDLPEMLLKLKQGMGRLIRTCRDRGVLALLDQSYRGQPWAGQVAALLPEGAEQTSDLARVAAFCPAPGA